MILRVPRRAAVLCSPLPGGELHPSASRGDERECSERRALESETRRA